MVCSPGCFLRCGAAALVIPCTVLGRQSWEIKGWEHSRAPCVLLTLLLLPQAERRRGAECLAGLCSSGCSVRYENLPSAFLLFYFYTYVLTVCHLEIKAGMCSSAAAAELCLLLICCFAQIRHLWGQRLLTAPSQIFQPPTL